MNEDKKNRLILAGIGVVLIWFALFAPHASEWSGDGSISAFPDGADAKNYRLPAQLDVTRHKRGWFQHKDTYVIDSAQWPDGGTMELTSCTVQEGSSANCADQSGRTYRIEVQSVPDEPESDPGDYN